MLSRDGVEKFRTWCFGKLVVGGLRLQEVANIMMGAWGLKSCVFEELGSWLHAVAEERSDSTI